MAESLRLPIWCVYTFDLPCPGDPQPWLVVQKIPADTGSSTLEDAWESSTFLAMDKQVQAMNKLFRTEFRIEEKPYFDTSRKRAVLVFSGMINGHLVKGICFAYPGRDSVTQVNLYSSLSDFPASRAVFESIADTFEYSPGHEWVPRSMVSTNTLRNHPFLARIGLRWLVLAGIAAVGGMGGAGGMIRKFRRAGA